MVSYLTKRETAEALGIHENTLSNWARKKSYPDGFPKVDRQLRRWRVDADALDRFLKAHPIEEWLYRRLK